MYYIVVHIRKFPIVAFSIDEQWKALESVDVKCYENLRRKWL